MARGAFSRYAYGVKFAGYIAAVVTAMLLTLPCVAQDEDYVYTNEDLKKYYAPEPPLITQPEVEELFDPVEWETLEEFLATSYDRIDAERRESIARMLADQRARESRRTRYSVPYNGVYGYAAVQMWLWDRYHERYGWPRGHNYPYRHTCPEKPLDGRDAVPQRTMPPNLDHRVPLPAPRYSRPGRPDGRDAVPRRPMPPNLGYRATTPTPRYSRPGRLDGRDAVPRRPRPPASSRRSAPSRPSRSVSTPVGRGDGRDAVPRRGRR